MVFRVAWRSGRYSRLWLRCFVVIMTALSIAQCDKTAEIREGMGEADVRNVLGAPSRVATDRGDIQFYLGRDGECGKTSTKVLVFERRVREDVFVGVSAENKVVCIQKGIVVTH